ncbi:hypothetical protein ACJJTC_008030 [Scirpophaga incertulas]
MSQQRARIGPASANRGRISGAKVSGDSKLPDGHKKKRSGSKSEIPSSLRCDLENALVSLCDVWFEEIKPYLVRKNIKLHIHGAGSGGDSQQECGATGCFHLYPGAVRDGRRPQTVSYADFCSTQPTASKARSHRPPMHSHRTAPSPESHCFSENQSPCRSCKPHMNRARGPSHREAQPASATVDRQRRFSNPCGTNSLVTPTPPRVRLSTRLTELNTQRRVRVDNFKLAANECHETDVMLNIAVRKQQKNRKCIPHISEDLIDIIAENYDKQLKVLYHSSIKEESSISNLEPLPRTKKIPWR